MKESWLPPLLVLAACLFNVARFHEELTVSAPSTNDHIFHYALVEAAEVELQNGGNPFDYWLPLWGQGFPVARYYQQLPHLLVVAAHQLVPWVTLAALYQWFVLLGLALLPWSFQLGAQLLGFSPITAAWVAVCCALLGADPDNLLFLGLQQDKFVSLHGGMFAQLYGALFLAPALGLTRQALLRGRHYAWALLLLSATWLSHLLLGYAASLLALFVLLQPAARGQRRLVLVRYLVLNALLFAVLSHKLLPTLLETSLLSRTAWEDPSYWQGFGVGPSLRALFRGELLDGARLPVLTLLTALGVLWSWRSGRQAGAARHALVGFVLGLVLMAGHCQLGSAASVLPFGSKLPLHRFLCLLQLCAIMLAGFGLSSLLGWLRGDGSRLRGAGSTLLACLLLSPAALASFELGRKNGQLRRTIGRAYQQDAAFLATALHELVALSRFRPARSYAGTLWDGGERFSLAGVPIFTFLPASGLPSLSYLAHAMGHGSDLEPLFDAHNRAHYDLFNVRYLAAPERARLPDFSSVVSAAPGFVTATVDARGYFDLVDVGHVLDLNVGSYAELAARFVLSSWHTLGRFVRIRWSADEVIPDQLVRLTANEEFAPQVGHPLATGVVLREWGERGSYGADLQVARSCTALFRMSFHPGWQARLDGQPVATMMLAPSYLGVAVPPGKHRLTLGYRAPAWGSWLLAFGCLVLVAAFLIERRLVQREQSRRMARAAVPPLQ